MSINKKSSDELAREYVANKEYAEAKVERETLKFERMMQEGNIYKRGKGGAMKQVR